MQLWGKSRLTWDDDDGAPGGGGKKPSSKIVDDNAERERQVKKLQKDYDELKAKSDKDTEKLGLIEETLKKLSAPTPPQPVPSGKPLWRQWLDDLDRAMGFDDEPPKPALPPKE